jgi:type I restriction enzyme S subunit
MIDQMLSISEVAEIFDGPHATPKKIEAGPYFLSISSLDGGRLDLSKSAHVNEEQFVQWTKRVTPQKGDLLFSYETRLGEAALMPEGIRACLGRRMGLLRPKLNKVIPEYLLYAYISPFFQQVIKANTIVGATVDRIALSEMKDFPIRIPNLSEQKAACLLLSTIDKKIELNNRINAELEAMAKTLYEYWFVQFDFPDVNR